MKSRRVESILALALARALAQFPAVVLVGPRQVGKTTLAVDWVSRQTQASGAAYLDLELPSAQRQLDDPEAYLDDPEAYLMGQTKRLVVQDEVQRVPELFAVLRGIIDIRRREGEAAGQFLLLGSASGALLRQTSESLAGRVTTLELPPFLATELLPPDAPTTALTALWSRGGFPLSFLASDDAASLAWREAFIATYLERDIPTLGPRIPATTLRRLWTMCKASCSITRNWRLRLQ